MVGDPCPTSLIEDTNLFVLVYAMLGFLNES